MTCMHDVKLDEYSAARNEDLGRQVNERVKRRMGAMQDGKIHVLCECADPDCEEVIPLAAAEYERVRQVDSDFLVVTGHELPDVECIISSLGSWSIVRKTGEAGRLAEELRMQSRDSPG